MSRYLKKFEILKIPILADIRNSTFSSLTSKPQHCSSNFHDSAHPRNEQIYNRGSKAKDSRKGRSSRAFAALRLLLIGVVDHLLGPLSVVSLSLLQLARELLHILVSLLRDISIGCKLVVIQRNLRFFDLLNHELDVNNIIGVATCSQDSGNVQVGVELDLRL